MKTVLSNSLNENIHEKIKANKSNKFGSSGGIKSEEETASKCQEGREINQNNWISNDKTKSREPVLIWSPKKPGGEEAHNANSVPLMKCAPASISENSRKPITDTYV